jgi:hypothetical protein
MAVKTIHLDDDGDDSRRLDLDAMDARIAEIEAQERAQHPGLSLTPETPEQKLARLMEENERLRRMVGRSIEARNSAVEFVNMWADPRRLPDLVQEVYLSHPDIPKISAELSPETGRRVARLIAHMAITYQVHPLIAGMIYAWPDDGVARVELGYRAYMEMLKRHSLDFDGPFEIDEEQRALHGLKPDDRGAMYLVFDWARMERFRRFGRECQPFRGLGVWRNNQTVPKGRSGQWVAEKNALKDAARRALSFAVRELAEMQWMFEVTYDQDVDVWTVPAPTADWVRDPVKSGRFEKLLAEHGITDEEWNAHLGHNWRYTDLDPQEMHQRFLAYVQGKPAVVTGEAVTPPETTGEAPQTGATSTPTPPAAETADSQAVDPAAATTPEGAAEAVQAPLIVPCSFEGCDEPGADTPEGWLCPTHARKAADANAARSEGARK